MRGLENQLQYQCNEKYENIYEFSFALKGQKFSFSQVHRTNLCVYFTDFPMFNYCRMHSY